MYDEHNNDGLTITLGIDVIIVFNVTLGTCTVGFRRFCGLLKATFGPLSMTLNTFDNCFHL